MPLCLPVTARNLRGGILVRLIEGNPIRARPFRETTDLRWEVHKIGATINQIARSVNAGIAKAEDAKRGLYLPEQVYGLMYQAAKKQPWLIPLSCL